MHHRAVLVITLAALMLVPAAVAPARPHGKDRLQRVAKEGINTLRARTGVRPLRNSKALTRSASRYARYMLRAGYFGHLPRIRASRGYRSLGEVILMHRGGHGQPRTAVRRWANSPGHRYVILDRKYGQVGVGKASGRFRGRKSVV